MGGGDQTGGGAQTEGVISLTNKNISISYLIVITQVRFFSKFQTPLPYFRKKAEPQQFYQLRSPLIPEQPYQSFFNMTRKRHKRNNTRSCNTYTILLIKTPHLHWGEKP